MATKTVSVRRNADNTMTVRVGRKSEHISLEAKSRADIFDAIKWAAITHGVYLSDIHTIELLDQVNKEAP